MLKAREDTRRYLSRAGSCVRVVYDFERFHFITRNLGSDGPDEKGGTLGNSASRCILCCVELEVTMLLYQGRKEGPRERVKQCHCYCKIKSKAERLVLILSTADVTPDRG